jgi:hypothetical protein
VTLGTSTNCGACGEPCNEKNDICLEKENLLGEPPPVPPLFYCGVVCAPGSGTVECGGVCVNKVCVSGQMFNASTCQCECPSGTELCGGTCISSQCVNGYQFDSATCSCQCLLGIVYGNGCFPDCSPGCFQRTYDAAGVYSGGGTCEPGNTPSACGHNGPLCWSCSDPGLPAWLVDIYCEPNEDCSTQ